MAPKVITWDIEIMIGPDEHPDGWEGARRGECGVSCVSLYDTSTGRFHVYDEHDLEDCAAHLNSADLLVGFNTIEFDTPAFQGTVGIDILADQYDILHEIWKALPKREKGYRLGDLCERLKLGAKNGEGERATALYRDGRFGRLFDYCINDVALTRALGRFINENGYVLTPSDDMLELPRPGIEV